MAMKLYHYFVRVLLIICTSHLMLTNQMNNKSQAAFQDNQSPTTVKLYTLPGNSSTYRKLSRVPVITDTPPKNVILVSHFRSGSTYTGTLLQQNWKTWYMVEPLSTFKIWDMIRGEANETEAIRIIKALYTCDYPSLSSYLVDMNERFDYLFLWNRFNRALCNTRPQSCLDPYFLQEACIRSKYRLSKTTRLSLTTVEKLLDQLDDILDMKIVYLVRDPRAMFNSRKSLWWCMESACGDLEVLCNDLKSDLEAYKRLVQRYGDKIIGIRHEDLSLDMFDRAEKLYNAMEFPYGPGIRRFIAITSTQPVPDEVGKNPNAVNRIAKEVPLKWVKESLVNKTEVDQIQAQCSSVMVELGYKFIDFTPNSTLSYEDIMEPKVTQLPNFIH